MEPKHVFYYQPKSELLGRGIATFGLGFNLDGSFREMLHQAAVDKDVSATCPSEEYQTGSTLKESVISNRRGSLAY